jgi:hypothetical protein
MFDFLGLKKTGTTETKQESKPVEVLDSIVDTYVSEIPEISVDVDAERQRQIEGSAKVLDFFSKELSSTTFNNEREALLQKKKEYEEKIWDLKMTVSQNEINKLYPKIDLSFLSMKQPNKNGEEETDIFSSDKMKIKNIISFTPKFSIHQLEKRGSSFNFRACEIVFDIVGNVSKKYAINGVSLRAGSVHIFEHLVKVYHDKQVKMINDTEFPRFGESLLGGARSVNRVRCDFNVPRAGGRKWFHQDILFSSEFKGMIPSTTKKKIEKATDEFARPDGTGYDVYLIKECTDWESKAITKDPLIVGVSGDQAYLIDHFDCTDLEKYVKLEFGI